MNNSILFSRKKKNNNILCLVYTPTQFQIAHGCVLYSKLLYFKNLIHLQIEQNVFDVKPKIINNKFMYKNYLNS